MILNDQGIVRELCLNALAEALDAKFTVLAVSPQDQIYLLGSAAARGDDAYVIRLAADGSVEA